MKNKETIYILLIVIIIYLAVTNINYYNQINIYKQNENKDIFDLFISALKKINEGFNPKIITNILELKYLDYLGVTPIIDCCSVCGTKTNIKTLSSSAGGFVCNKCFKNDYIVSPKTLKMIRIYYYLDLEKIEKINVSDSIKNEINNFLDNYYERYTGLYLKSKNFIKALKNL